MESLNEKNAVVATIDPTVAQTATSTSDVVDMSKFGKVQFILLAGAIAATGTVDMDIQEGVSASSFNTATALKSITQLGATDDNKQVVVEVEGKDLTAGKRYLRAIVTQGTANSNIAMVAVGSEAPYGPASDNDLASATLVSA